MAFCLIPLEQIISNHKSLHSALIRRSWLYGNFIEIGSDCPEEMEPGLLVHQTGRGPFKVFRHEAMLK
jgi:hypothetical protein